MVSGLRVGHATRVFWGVLGTSIAMSARTAEKSRSDKQINSSVCGFYHFLHIFDVLFNYP